MRLNFQKEYMDKKIVLGIIIVLFVLIGFSYFSQQSQIKKMEIQNLALTSSTAQLFSYINAGIQSGIFPTGDQIVSVLNSKVAKPTK